MRKTKPELLGIQSASHDRIIKTEISLKGSDKVGYGFMTAACEVAGDGKTLKQFCDMLDVDYEELLKRRKKK